METLFPRPILRALTKACISREVQAFAIICAEEIRIKRGDHPLDILNGRGQETLLAHVLDAKHARIAQAMIDFGLRK